MVNIFLTRRMKMATFKNDNSDPFIFLVDKANLSDDCFLKHEIEELSELNKSIPSCNNDCSLIDELLSEDDNKLKELEKVQKEEYEKFILIENFLESTSDASFALAETMLNQGNIGKYQEYKHECYDYEENKKEIQSILYTIKVLNNQIDDLIEKIKELENKNKEITKEVSLNIAKNGY